LRSNSGVTRARGGGFTASTSSVSIFRSSIHPKIRFTCSIPRTSAQCPSCRCAPRSSRGPSPHAEHAHQRLRAMMSGADGDAARRPIWWRCRARCTPSTLKLTIPALSSGRRGHAADARQRCRHFGDQRAFVRVDRVEM
jgi:hypothetical protein